MRFIRPSKKQVISYLCASTLSVLWAGQAAGAQTSSTVNVSPGDNVQAAVKAAPANTTFVFEPGTYRMQSVIPKNGDVFTGGSGSVIFNGSQVLSFVSDPAGSGLWVANAVADSTWKGTCQDSSPLCGYSQDLFIDSILQTPQVSPVGLAAGSWYFDRTNGKVYLSSNPSGHVVEIGMTNFAFSGTASNVEIDHITVEKYATPTLQGAIGGNYWALGPGWVVNEVESRLNHGAGIMLGSQSSILNSFIHHNGQEGIKFYFGVNCVAAYNEISWNNTDGFSNHYESGGSKFWSTTNLQIKSNYVHDNYGIGLWTDTDNVNTLYDGNTVINNADAGIQHEVSYAAIIRNNIVEGNAAAPSTWVGNSQIRLFSSSNVQIYGNTVEVSAVGGSGISIINMTRGTGIQGPWVAANNSVYNNTITYLGMNGGSGFENDTPGNTAGVNNSFDYNTYILPYCSSPHWVWQTNTPIDWATLQSLGQEAHGTFSIAAAVAGAPAPVVSVSTSNFKFANTHLGTTQKYAEFTLSNTGNAPLYVCSVGVTGGNASSFSIPIYRQNCGTVEVGSSCTFQASFTPTKLGPLSTGLTISSNGTDSTPVIALSGVGVAP